jgi:hypothetical protein
LFVTHFRLVEFLSILQFFRTFAGGLILIPFDYSRWWLVLTGIIFLVCNTWYLLIPGLELLDLLWPIVISLGLSVPFLVMVLFYLIGYTRFHITLTTIVLSYKLLGITFWKSRKLRIEHISKIELSEADMMTSFWPQLNIWAGKRKINLISGQLTKPEMDWLSYEVSDWLKVPVDRHLCVLRS